MSSLDLDLEEPETYYDQEKRLYSVIQNYLQPKTPKTLQQTAASILAMLPKKEPHSIDVWMFGELCIIFAERIPYHHPLQPKLVGFLDYLKLSPQLCQIGDDQDPRHHEPTGQFVRHIRFKESMVDNIGNRPDPEKPGEHVNFHCFAANLIEQRVLYDDPTWAIWALRDAHEEFCKEEGKWRQHIRDERMMAAGQWILWWGQGLFKQVIFPREVDLDDIANSLRPGQLYRGEGGLSLGRWRFWKDGFASVAAGAEGEKDGYGEECVRVLAKAADIMETLEESMMFDGVPFRIMYNIC